jgi:hypothetical protein
MSADLLAAFGDGPGSSSSQPARATVPSSGTLINGVKRPIDLGSGIGSSRDAVGPLWTPGEDGDDILFDAAEEEDRDVLDDDFGDFEDAEHVIQHSNKTRSSLEHNKVASDMPANTVEQESALIDLLSLDEGFTAASSDPNTSQPLYKKDQPMTTDFLSVGPTPHIKETIPTTIEDDDDWGDFEAVAAGKIADNRDTTSGTQDESTLAGQKPESEVQTDDDPWDDFDDGVPEVKAQPATSAVPQKNVMSFDDGWAAFESSTDASLDMQNGSKATQSSDSDSAIPPKPSRPTNVPPPALLLSLLPQIYNTLTKEPPPASLLLHVYHTTARITAARALRWRRDNVLSQSTRISVAGSKSGMKLSSVNKSESAREEREASEALTAWNQNVPRWHGVLRDAGMKMEKGKGLRLQLPLGVRTLAGNQGAMNASYLCPVCGMKRNERVVGVDEVVEDIFGEFWHEGWGHKACAETWYSFKGLLGQR